MKFLIDAQLPRSLAQLLRENGFDAVHTTELPNGNETTDAEINQLSMNEERIVISKDLDFYNSFTSKKEPYKLLQVRTGNISNVYLLKLFEKNFDAVLKELEQSDVVETDRRYLIALH